MLSSFLHSLHVKCSLSALAFSTPHVLENLYAAEHSVHSRFMAFSLNKLPPRAALLEVSSHYNQTTANSAVSHKPYHQREQQTESRRANSLA